MPPELLFKLLVIFAAFGGFLIAAYIQHTKKKHETMTCPLGASCDVVVHSKFSSFFGIETAVWGMAYYLFIAVFYGLLVVLGKAIPPELAFLAFGISIVAVLFSAYLTVIQSFVLRNWCTWCLFSAVISVLILIFTSLGVTFDLPALLAQYKVIIVTLHALGAAIGVGAVTVTDFSFFRFLKDYRISKKENETIKMLSQLIWVALAIVIVTGIGLYIPNAAVLNATPKFLVKALLVAALVLNGVVLNIIVSPRLIDISFRNTRVKQKGRLDFLRKIAFASGAFSITTWYAVFFLGSIREWTFTFGQILSGYLVLVIFAIILSQIFEQMIAKGNMRV